MIDLSKFNNIDFSKINSMQDLVDTAIDLFGAEEERDPSDAELAIINSIDVLELQNKIETVAFGLRKNPMLVCCASTGIELYDNIDNKNIPKHHMEILTAKKNVHISYTLDANFKKGYYMSEALKVRDRSSVHERFEGNQIIFQDGVLQGIEVSPAHEKGFSVILRTSKPGAQSFLDFTEEHFYFNTPEDINTFVNDTGINDQYFKMFWDFEHKKYGRSKFPKFFCNLNGIDLDSVYNIYK